MSLCQNCQAQAERQAEQMRPRSGPLVGTARLLRSDGFDYIGPAPDLRLNDVVRVQLVAGSVEDMGYCSDEQCENFAP